MAVKLINVGFAPEAVLSAIGLDEITHTGLPSVQLQDAVNAAEADTAGAYPKRSVRRVERDASGYITRIIDEPEEQ